MPNRLTKIYTRTGDSGTTQFQGQQLSKDDARIAAIGSLDELNAVLGMLHAQVAPAIAAVLTDIQQQLFDIGAELHMADHVIIKQSDIDKLERQLDAWNTKLPPLKEFLLPQGSMAITLALFARTVARRAERTLIAMHQQHSINPHTIAFVNRLSDLLFVMAREIANMSNTPEVMWRGLKEKN